MSILTTLLLILIGTIGWPHANDMKVQNDFSLGRAILAGDSNSPTPSACSNPEGQRVKIKNVPRAVFSCAVPKLELEHDQLKFYGKSGGPELRNTYSTKNWSILSMLLMTAALANINTAVGAKSREVVISIGRLSKPKDSEEQTKETIASSLAVVRKKVDELFNADVEIVELAEQMSGLVADRSTILQAKQMIKAGNVTCVIVEDLSRLRWCRFRGPRGLLV